MAAFATVTGDAALEAKVDFSRTEIAELRDELIDDRAQLVLDAAGAHLAALAPYGIAQATLDVLAARIAAYVAVVQAPRAATVKVKSITQAVADTFDAADRVLKGVLDRLALQFQAGAPAFFVDYTNARTIVDRPGGVAEKPAPVPA